MSRAPVFHEAELRKAPLALAALLDLLAGGFACYLGSGALLGSMISYALAIAALYLGGLKCVVAMAASLAASTYGAFNFGGEPAALLAASALLKASSLAIRRGVLRLRSDVRGLASLAAYLRENPQALFIIPFMALLVLAAAKLALGDEDMANRLAEYAYYQLVAGVATALILVARERGG